MFRFVLRPHRRSNPAEASRFATGFSQPLVAHAAGSELLNTPLLRVEPADVLVSGLKPSDDGRALIVRLFGGGDQSRSARLRWGDRKPKAVYLSDTGEKAGEKVTGHVVIPGHGLVTLRAEF